MLDILQNFDVSLLNSLRNWINPDSIIQVSLIKSFADSELFVFAFFLVVLWFLGIFRKNDQYKILALELFWPVVFAIMVCLFLNSVLPFRPRPEDVSSFLPLISHIPDNSFPSMHAIFAGASCMSLFQFWSRLKKLALPSPMGIILFFMILGIIMIFSRVFAGIHYPGDIFVGYIIGLFVAYMSIRFILPTRFFQKIGIHFMMQFARFFHL